MKKVIYISIAFALMFNFISELFAQENYTDQLLVENLTISKEADITDISMDVNFSNLKLNRNEMIIITPVIVSPEKDNKVELEPFTIIGKVRNKVLNRSYNSIGKVVLNYPEENKVVRRNGKDQSIQYTTSLPFEEWQRDAQLILKTEVIGCADCLDNEPDMLLSDRMLPERFVPEYSYKYIVPEVEGIKQRSETYSAHINFIVGESRLLLEYKNNKEVFIKVGQVINDFKIDKDLTISSFTITGYASPEATVQTNMLLSQQRAEGFAKYLADKYELPLNQFTVNWVGEDWEGLRKAVEASNYANKNQIIDIIDNVADLDVRETRIIALDNGVTYRKLYNQFYPPLRRIDYAINYVSRPFEVEEAAELIKTRPNLLSLNEMFLVANTFPEGSKEYNQVFEIAAKTFPESDIANINVAVQELRNNETDQAIARLGQFTDNPDALNLLGIAYANKELYDKAQEYLNQAIAKGNKGAEHNMQQLKRVLEDN